MPLIERKRRLGNALVAYLFATIAIVTLVPLSFRWPDRLVLTGFVTTSDVALNVALFLPLGFFVAFAGGRAAVVGALLSLIVELGQQFIPGRFPSLLDFAANTAGAAIGGGCYRWLGQVIGPRTQVAGVRALDLPLMGSVYLSIPMMWLEGLATSHDPDRRWLVAFPVLATIIVIASVDRHHLRPRGFPRWSGPGGAAMWVIVAMTPGWHRWPAGVVAAGLAAAAGTSLFTRWLATIEPIGRRYEIPTVRRALLPLAAFLAIVAASPITEVRPSWQGSFGWSTSPAALGQEGLIGAIELMATSTVIGFAIAEARGRAIESATRTRTWLAVAGALVGLVVEGIRGFHPDHRATLLEAVLLAAATMAGGVLYHRQRAYVVALLDREPHRTGDRSVTPEATSRPNPDVRPPGQHLGIAT